jgi:hypothetical protein
MASQLSRPHFGNPWLEERIAKDEWLGRLDALRLYVVAGGTWSVTSEDPDLAREMTALIKDALERIDFGGLPAP